MTVVCVVENIKLLISFKFIRIITANNVSFKAYLLESS
jgi:hypothetical protein